MKSRMRMQYYCDHCKKSGANRYHIERHEKACTANPSRVCGVCGKHGVYPLSVDVGRLAKDEKYNDEIIADLRDIAEGCPACMLAALRQTCMLAALRKIESNAWCFDYNAEHAKYWAARDREEREGAGY